MRLTFLIPVTFLFNILGQDTNFNLSEIKFRGIGFSATKEEVVTAFGKPNIHYPDYECGFYSNYKEGITYYQLIYNDFNYIGRDEEGFILEEVKFDKDGKTKLFYGDQVISGLTTKEEFIQIFGDYAKEYFLNYPDADTIVIFSEKDDDGGRFSFEGNKLSKFEYYSPC